MPMTLANGQAAPAGFTITRGESLSGQCQDPNGCYAEPSTPTASAPTAAQQSLRLEPMANTNYAVPLGGQCQTVVDPVTGQSSQMCEDPQQDQRSAAQMMGIEPNMSPMRAQPMSQPAAPTMDPYNTWRAQAFTALATGGPTPDKHNAVALTALGASQARAQELMNAGYPYDDAVAQAQREALDGGGYRASGIASGATGAATTQLNAAAAKEAELMYLTGTGELSNVGRNLFGAGTGQVFMGPGGFMYRSTADGRAEIVNVSANAAAADPALGARMLTPTPGASVKRADAAEKAATDVNKLIAQSTFSSSGAQALEATRQINRADLVELRARVNAAARGNNGKLKDDADTDALAQAAYQSGTCSSGGAPFAAFKKTWLAQAEKNLQTGINILLPCEQAAPAGANGGQPLGI